MSVTVVEGDLLDQPVEVIVNAWNRNLIPWWLLWPQGVSGAIRRRAGTQPFRELCQAGVLPPGGAVLTGAGRLPFRGIIHVAGLNLLWVATRRTIQDSVRSALALVREHAFVSVAFPLIGAGTGGFRPAESLALMQDAVVDASPAAAVRIVRLRAFPNNP